MSRIGKQPIQITEGTQIKVESGFVIVKGPKGELKQKLHQSIHVDLSDNQVKVSVDGTSGKEMALWGLFRSLIKNMVVGVNQGYERKLEINGVGYRAVVNGDKLTLNIGYSHPVIYCLPKGIEVKVDNNIITLSGIDKQLVGETAAQIRKIRKPEPYKGKGIKYSDEVIRRKIGKTAGKVEK